MKRFALLAVGFAFLAGCSQQPGVKSVAGTITFDGKPLAHAKVVLWPVEPNGHSVVGMTDKDGRFRIDTASHPSIRLDEGEHIVLVSLQDDKHGEPLSKILDPYGDPETSPLRAQIAAGDNRIESIEIKKLNIKSKAAEPDPGKGPRLPPPPGLPPMPGGPPAPPMPMPPMPGK